ncbi:uncharacterized protein F4822DRAFT_417045 [Hypoxylon trugodes]|uniref:uncharacterized protein n=1 Tax=Hypoxylon trugodes TaxID=326681 RepID=UPI0021950D4D|nr:uncharacterized protein F4822DRAFT_417045 [Hypoxylon trugodes]KAI1385020.1 hypothetical protein F4822DRAFT_417045 [Hypoxylon trugodes]
MASKTASRPEASRGKQSSILQAVLTPIHFLSFLLSLYLIDCHYHDKRMQENSERYSRLPSWLLPAWLDRILFRQHPQPYGWVDKTKPGTSAPTRVPTNGERKERWYFHTKQKKLMKMEAADAFELQRAILLGLLVVVVCATWMLWRLSRGFWAWYVG